VTTGFVWVATGFNPLEKKNDKNSKFKIQNSKFKIVGKKE